MYTIGIDIGGTHTDGVLLNSQGKIQSWGKSTTTIDLEAGVKIIISSLLAQAYISPADIQAVMIGTTHATNAILEEQHLLPVGLIRLLDGKPRFPSPGFSWPMGLKQKVINAYETCEGSYECDGRASARFNKQTVKIAILRLLEKGVKAFSVVGAFSPLNGTLEQEVGHLIQDLTGPHFPYSLSHQIGGIGFIERENATLLNSALKHVMAKGFVNIQQILKQLNIQAPLWMTQNNGSLMSLEEALEFPIKTIGAGPTNSFMGAVRLCGVQDALVVDMGGTSTDIGIVEKGYARSSLHAATIGGIPLHFAMPDMISLALGGGSHITFKEQDECQIGPHSVAKKLATLSKVFGGSHLTLTDVGIAADLLHIEQADKHMIGLSCIEAKSIALKACQQVYQSLVRLKGRQKELPIILVGGGAALLRPLLHDFQLEGWIPELASIANAYGAGLAEVCGVVDQVVSLKERETVLEQLKQQAKTLAITKGADPQQVRITSLSILPFAYTTDALAKVVITASGTRMRT